MGLCLQEYICSRKEMAMKHGFKDAHADIIMPNKEGTTVLGKNGSLKGKGTHHLRKEDSNECEPSFTYSFRNFIFQKVPTD